MLGEKLRDRYYIFKELATGGFGQTFLANDCDFPGHPWCVVKQLKPQVKGDWMLQTARRLFDLEASVLAHIGNHPQIPQLKAHFEEDEQFYLVQEFIEGDLLSKELSEDSIWSQGDAIAFLKDILGTLKFVHDNQVIHRDLKPENIIRRPSDRKLVLIDFGSVKKITTLHEKEEEEDSEFTVVIGTPSYMPLEQQGGKPSYCSDIYAVGKIVIQGLSGVPAKQMVEDSHSGELLWRHLVDVDDSFAEVLSRMVKWKARDRYQNVSEILQDLKKCHQHLARKNTSQTSLQKSTNYQTIDEIISELKDHPEIARIKKLLFCTSEEYWENNPRVLAKYRTKYLVKKICERETTLESFKRSINGVVKTLNKKDKYQLLANLIVNKIKPIYDAPRLIDAGTSEKVHPSPYTEVIPSDGSEPKSYPINLDSRKTLNIDQNHHTDSEDKKATNSDDSREGSQELSPQQVESLESFFSVNTEVKGVSKKISKPGDEKNQDSKQRDHDLFDIRYEVTRYTTPLRIKILLFSTLYYQVGLNEQDWSLMMSHQLDSLLKKLIEIFPTLSELEARLYATAQNFDEKEGLTQAVGAILQSLRPFYKSGQPKLNK